MPRPLALVTGASTGIGYALARLAAVRGCDLVIAADEPRIHDAATTCRSLGAEVVAVEANLADMNDVDRLLTATGGRRIDYLLANAGTGRGGAFLDQPVGSWRHVVDTNITGTLYLIQKILADMVARDSGRILVTGSIVGFIPGAFNAVYNASKAFIDSFTEALRSELRDHPGVTLTTLMPGATDTEFFRRADMEDTLIGRAPKADAEMVARKGWDAMMEGRNSIVPGLSNKLQVAAAGIVPQPVLAELHRQIAEPDHGRSGEK